MMHVPVPQQRSSFCMIRFFQWVANKRQGLFLHAANRASVACAGPVLRWSSIGLTVFRVKASRNWEAHWQTTGLDICRQDLARRDGVAQHGGQFGFVFEQGVKLALMQSIDSERRPVVRLRDVVRWALRLNRAAACPLHSRC